MAPKSSDVYVILQGGLPTAAYSTEAAANEAAEALDDASVHQLEVKQKVAKAPKPTKAKAPAKGKAAKAEAEEDEDDGEKSGLAQRIDELVASTGNALDGLTIVVTGVPTEPSVNRKDVDALVTNYGGHLTKSLSGNTSFVVMGANAGPTKLKKIEELGIETLDLAQLVERIGEGGDKSGPAKKKRKT